MSRERVVSARKGVRDVALVACIGWLAFEAVALMAAVALFHPPMLGVASVAGVVLANLMRAAIVTLVAGGAGLLS